VSEVSAGQHWQANLERAADEEIYCSGKKAEGAKALVLPKVAQATQDGVEDWLV
jgi:hypothetical protein